MEQQRPTPRRAAPLTRRQRRLRRRLRLARNWALFLAACAAAVALMTSGILWLLPRVHALLAGPEPFVAAPYDGTDYHLELSDPRLVLVNANLVLESEPAPVLAVADDATGQQLESEAAQAYRAMAAAAQADGVTLLLTAGYQDTAAREAAYAAQVELCRAQGLAEETAMARAAAVQPQAQASEMATGYGAEILDEQGRARDTSFAESRAYAWLTAYAAEYGFILRWPQESQAATGMVFEPWHWRYVGAENALAIRASGLSLEEFLAVGQLAAAK